MDKIKMLLMIVRTRHFAYKATKQDYHRILRDEALNELKWEIRAYRADKTIILKLAA